MALALGTRLGTFEVVSLLGAGGMGEVYRAHDSNLRRDVALKVLPAALIADPERVARFEREARAVAALSHPNILAIHHLGRDDGVMYAVTELLEGRTLRALLRGGPLAPQKALAIVSQIARGLEAAHARGIVHRDLKPENVFVLDDGQVKILDFGLAKATGIGEQAAANHQAPDRSTTVAVGVTGAGAVLGTAGYMAPEQVRGGAVDQRADIFAFGCMLFELLAGRRAFHGDSSIDTLHATLHADPPDVATLAAVPEPLSRIVGRCLEKQPANRFQTAADLRFALDNIGDAARSSTRPPVSARGPVPLFRIAVAAVVIAAAAAGVWYRRGAPTSAPRAAVAPQARGIAVLPFDSLGEAGPSDFAAGVTEEVTLQLAKVSALRVMSSAAVSRFKGVSELPTMARELGIGAVLTGSVRHADQRVRVGVQLLAAPSGETLWGEQYDRTMANIFDVQSDIAVRVARALQASLAPEERQRIERVPTDNAAAYELYLQQRRLANGVPAQNQQGIDLLQKAIALDPQFALGHAMLAQRFVWKGNVHGRAEYVRGVEAGRNAVRIDPQLAPGHHSLGTSLSRAGQVEEARLSMQRAIELNSNYQEAMWDLGLLEVNAGRLDQAVYWTMRAWPLAPNVPTSYYHLALSLLFLDPALGERWVDAALTRFKSDNPSSVVRLVMQRAIMAMRRGDHAAAVAQARDAVRLRPDYYGAQSVLAEMATYAGTADAEALVDAAVKESPSGRGWWQAYTPRTLRAYLYVRGGRPDRARPLLDAVLDINRKAIDEGDGSDKPWSENVAVHAMLGDREAALHAWERAVEMGFVEEKIDVYDALLAPLKDDPRFVAALDRVRRRAAEMRGRVDLTVINEWIARGVPTNAVR